MYFAILVRVKLLIVLSSSILVAFQLECFAVSPFQTISKISSSISCDTNMSYSLLLQTPSITIPLKCIHNHTNELPLLHFTVTLCISKLHLQIYYFHKRLLLLTRYAEPRIQFEKTTIWSQARHTPMNTKLILTRDVRTARWESAWQRSASTSAI